MFQRMRDTLQSQEINRAGRFLISAPDAGQSPRVFRSVGSFALEKGGQLIAVSWEGRPGRRGHHGAQCQLEGPPFCGGTRSNEDGQEGRRPNALSQGPV